MGSIHLLALIAAGYAAPRLTSQALTVLAATLIAGGGAFFLNGVLDRRGFCVGCDDQAWSNVALLCGGYGLAALAFLSRSHSSVARFVLVGCLLVPLVQAGLLIATPKLCFSCVSAGVANILGAAWLRSVPDHEAISVRRAFMTPVAIIATLVFVGSFVARPQAPQSTRMTSLVGRSSRSVGLDGPDVSYEVVLLALPGCHWCEESRKWLSGHHVPVREENLRDAKFAGRPVDSSFAPQLLVLRHGIVTQHIPGLNVEEYARLQELP